MSITAIADQFEQPIITMDSTKRKDWKIFDEGHSIGCQGSQQGSIMRDEDWRSIARITLEGGGNTAPFAMTCGIAGWMVHTRFFSTEGEAQIAFEKMKPALTRIVDLLPEASQTDSTNKASAVVSVLKEFVRQFP